VTLRVNDVVCEIYLIPLEEEEEDQKRLLSMQLTGAAINEFIELSPDLVAAIAGRHGRFPSKADGGPPWYGIIADSNAPVEGSDWWTLIEQAGSGCSVTRQSHPDERSLETIPLAGINDFHSLDLKQFRESQFCLLTE
jgi:hypothetical protein